MQVRLIFTGSTPLLMHNVQLADPENEFAKNIKAMTSKRKKTEDDYAVVAKNEFFGGLYLNADGPCIPTQNVRKCLIETGKITRAGKTIQRAFIPLTLEVPLLYDGPRNPEGLWDGGKSRFVHRANAKVGTSTVMRTRPCFPEWRVEVDAELLTNVINIEDFDELVGLSGTVEGLGDGRSMGYGRFEAVVKHG